MSEVSFRWIQDQETLFEHTPAWQVLLNQSPQSSPFQTPAFVHSLLKSQPQLPLRVLSLWQNDTLVGLGLWQAKRIMGLPALSVLGTGNSLRLTPEYCDLLHLEQLDSQTLIEATVKALQARRDWLILHFPDQLEHSKLTALEQHFTHQSARPGLRFAIPLTLGTDPLTQFAPKVQAKLRRNLRRAERLGGARLVRLPQNEALETLQALHAKRWHDDNIYALAPFKATHQRWLQSDETWIWGLEIEGEIHAAVQVIERGNTLYYYQSGFRADYANHLSPLNLLHLLVMRLAVHRGITEYDLMRGEADSYKINYPADTTPMLDHYSFRFAGLQRLWQLKNTLSRLRKPALTALPPHSGRP